MKQIRDRIKEFRRVPAKELMPNPKNWRRHPAAQQKAMTAVLKEIGFAGAVLAREAEDGSLVLIDGHLRAGTATESEIPVLVLDVTEAEADKQVERYGREFLPITVEENLAALTQTGFSVVELFWYSHIQAGFYAIH